jgi:GNAT superfamily N-acetyltransferase
MRGEDIPAGMRLKDLAGWNQTARDWERFLESNPEGCFVAESGGRVIGTSTSIVYEERLAWIGMVLVDPEYRRQGIGLRLLDTALECLDVRRIPTVKLDATPEGRPIYERRGFVPEFAMERWRLERKPTQPPCRKELAKADLLAIFKLDREMFGAGRSRLLASLDREAAEFTLAKSAAGKLVAYSFGRHGSRADHLGPWVASEESAAEEVLDEFLCLSAREVVFVDLVKAHPFAEKLLRSRGFAFSRPLTRMVRGANSSPGRAELCCAALGPEFG